METANNLSQLEEFIDQTRKESKYKLFETTQETSFLGIKIGGKSSGDGFINYHKQIIFRDQKLDIKTTTLIGYLSILKLRPIVEKFYNNSFIVNESVEDKVKREVKILEALEKENIPSFKQKQHIQNELKNPYNDVLITTFEENLENSLDHLKTLSRKEKQKYLVEVGKLLKKVHDKGIIWGDARLGNTATKQGEIYIFEFGFKPNPKLNLDYLKSKDLMGLMLNAAGVKNLTHNDLNSIIEGYEPSKEIIKNIHFTNQLGKEKFYLEPIHAIDMMKAQKVLEYLK